MSEASSCIWPVRSHLLRSYPAGYALLYQAPLDKPEATPKASLPAQFPSGPPPVLIHRGLNGVQGQEQGAAAFSSFRPQTPQPLGSPLPIFSGQSPSKQHFSPAGLEQPHQRQQLPQQAPPQVSPVCIVVSMMQAVGSLLSPCSTPAFRSKHSCGQRPAVLMLEAN